MKIEHKLILSAVAAAARQTASDYRCVGTEVADDIGDAFDTFAQQIVNLTDKDDDE